MAWLEDITGFGIFQDAVKCSNGLKFCNRKKIFSKRAVMHWHKLPRKVMEPLTLKEFIKRLDVVLRDVV